MTGLVAYYRVSTERQGQSGLGLDAQSSAVSGYAASRLLLGEFVEIESGRKDDRPELARALALCRQHKARLVIAKLGRLARTDAFISNLMASGVDFLAVDMPAADKLTVHILAAVAEHEREMIGRGTRPLWPPPTRGELASVILGLRWRRFALRLRRVPPGSVTA